MSKLKAIFKKFKSYSRLLRKEYLRNKMPFYFIKICFIYDVELGSWRHYFLKALVHNGFEFVPKNGDKFSAKDDEIICKKQNYKFMLQSFDELSLDSK